MRKVGDRVPAVTFRTRNNDDWQEVTTADLFDGKTVVLFAVPGAFTPTCSVKHLPGFVAHADEIKAKGVDTIACLSVNDAFVMDAWGSDQKAGGKVMMVADGNGELTQKLGLEMDGSAFGIGTRSQRYAMVVKDGSVAALHVEEPGAFEVSSAEAVLKAL